MKQDFIKLLQLISLKHSIIEKSFFGTIYQAAKENIENSLKEKYVEYDENAFILELINDIQ